jgi:hypothetical protein
MLLKLEKEKYMTPENIIEKYCNTCVHKNKCYKLCPDVLRAIYLDKEEVK